MICSLGDVGFHRSLLRERITRTRERKLQGCWSENLNQIPNGDWASPLFDPLKVLLKME